MLLWFEASMRFYTFIFWLLSLPGLRWIYPTLKRLLARWHEVAAFSAAAQVAEEDAQWYRSREHHHLQSVIEKHRLAGSYEGRRVFIMGNGPSLGKMDLSPLRDEFTIGTNRIYLLREKMGWTPSFYVCCNQFVIEQSVEQIRSIDALKFLSCRGTGYLDPDERTAFVRSLFPHRFPDGFSRDLVHGWNEGSTVTFCCIQLAYYLGFSEIILIGVDHVYSASTMGKPHQVIRTGKPDVDHFSPDYFGPHVQWQLPDLAGSEQSYRSAKHVFEPSGRRLVDATLEGRLQIFPKVRYEELF